MLNKAKKIKNIFIVYWFLVLYIVAALIWWFIALSQQNHQMIEFKKSRLASTQPNFHQQYESYSKEEKRKTTQYIGEGAIFLLLISVGAFFLFNAVNNQLKNSIQQQNFMMAITHELKTPIAVTKLNLETLLKRKLQETQQEKLITNTLQEADRMNALCNNLLLSSQMEGGGYVFSKEKINLSELVEASIREFSTRFQQKNIELTIDKNVFVSGDLFLLQMAINNLIDNANKYSNKETVLKIKLISSQSYCKLYVIDEGIGISDKDKKYIFEKFYRIGSDATKKSKGTGLGLFLVSRIMLAHKSLIRVEDNEPMGSKFIIEMKTFHG